MRLDCLAIFDRPFLLLISSFELHIIWLKYFSTRLLFDQTGSPAVHWLNRFSYRIAIYCFLNRSPSHTC